MDKALRNTLRLMVKQARELLEETTREQLQGIFGIHADGTIESMNMMNHLTEEDQQYRTQILIHLQHIQSAGFKATDAIAQLIREVSFTHLNRLCAYKMMEKRKIIKETVSRGLKSRGFIFYLAEHSEEEALHTSGKQDVAYRHYIEWLGDTLSQEIGVLFSSNDPANRLFPPQRVLDAVLVLINSEELQDIWSEDETIGWVYQYFTPKELRDKAREESQAPRNSYELAFRNQFYTPRYVVHFLTDNTLGRTWYEMRQGKTRIVEQCTYMVRHPDEVFFGKADSPAIKDAKCWLQGENVPEPDLWSLAHTINAYERREQLGEEANVWVEECLPRLTSEHISEFKTQELLDLLFLFCRRERFNEGTLERLKSEIVVIMAAIRKRVESQRDENRSQEEMLLAPFFIAYRATKDPRDIKILDPACGSGHFLLYCFDLLETIYLESYETSSSDSSLKQDYPNLVDLHQALPGLIMAHNLYGIDIDVRATQIASLALWLRAQYGYEKVGLTRNQDLPKITRSNIVCAEPMPGEQDLLNEFTNTLQPRILGNLVQTIFDKMRLASEAGSLLKIEIEIKEAILEAKQLWLRKPKAEQLALWSRPEKIVQQELLNEVEITDMAFWNEAGTRVIEALRTYAISVSNGKRLARQLFMDDAVQGFAFIDICQKPFDIVLMNPPFGEASKPSKIYVDNTYPRTKNDVYAAFVERWLEKLVSHGKLGAITSRTGFFLTSFQKWREEILLKEAKPVVFADLGNGVLDAAMVETAAYCLEKADNQGSTSFYRVLEASPGNKGQALINTITSNYIDTTYIANTYEFFNVPGSPFAYWVHSSVRKLFRKYSNLQDQGYECYQGIITADDNRFLRLSWEINDRRPLEPEDTLKGLRWSVFAKGGEFSRFYGNPHMLIDCKEGFAAIIDNANLKYPYLKGSAQKMLHAEPEKFFAPGLTYTRRTSKSFSVRILPRGTVFSDKGPGIILRSNDIDKLYVMLAILNSSSFAGLLALSLGAASAAARSYEIGLVERIPVPIQINKNFILAKLAHEAYDLKRQHDFDNEVSYSFCLPSLIMYRKKGLSLGNIGVILDQATQKINQRLIAIKEEIDEICWKLYGLEEEARRGIMLSELVLNESHIQISSEEDNEDEVQNLLEGISDYAKSLVQWSIGAVYGRWDLRLAVNPSLLPKLQDAFASLPLSSPGTLVSPTGLLANTGSIVSEEWIQARSDATTLPEEGSIKQLTIPNSDYLININWNGILVDDPEHEEDIIRRMRETFRIIWKEQADAIEQEACQILGIKELRDYFRRSGNGGFWTEHIQRYSKSRRKAPIFWLLQSSKKNYAVWLYYQRLNSDTLFKVLQEYIEPKLRREETVLTQLRTQHANSETVGKAARLVQQQLERQESFLSELEDFRDKVRRAADLNLIPDFNDGVVLNVAPLWELVPWSEAKRYWQELLSGKHAWSSIGKQLREKGLV